MVFVVSFTTTVVIVGRFAVVCSVIVFVTVTFIFNEVDFKHLRM